MIRAVFMMLWLAGPAFYAPLFAAAPPGLLNYQAYCEVVDGKAVNGYVRNASPGTYQVNGVVRFTFSNAKGISHHAIAVAGNIFIPPGQTVLAASSPLPYVLEEGEKCGFEVEGAIVGISR